MDPVRPKQVGQKNCFVWYKIQLIMNNEVFKVEWRYNICIMLEKVLKNLQ